MENARLSIAECRRLVGTGSDEELALARDHLYALANLTVQAFVEVRLAGGSPAGGPLDGALGWLPEEDAEDAQERAAIIEFDGRKPRPEAERRALRGVLRKRCRNDHASE